MDLVDEEHVVLLQRGQDAGQVARLVQHRSAGNLEPHTQLVGDNVGEGGLAQSWRTMQQGVVERFASVSGCLHKYAEVVHHLFLSAEIVKRQGSEGILVVLFRGRQLLLMDVEIYVCHDFLLLSVQSYSLFS